METADDQLADLRKISSLNELQPSTLQDMEKGKRIEYDAIMGAVIRAAARHHIEVPMTRAMYSLLKLIDRTRSNQSSLMLPLITGSNERGMGNVCEILIGRRWPLASTVG